MGNTNSNLFFFKGLIVFWLNDLLFCTDIRDAFAIVNPSDFPNLVRDSILKSPNIDVENLTIPIVDLHPLFKLKKSSITTLSRFICMEMNEHTFCFITDKVEELIMIDDHNRNEFDLIDITEEKFLSRIVKHHDKIFRLPNFDEIINELLIHH